MTSRHAFDERRTAFGRVAELYDRARPSYPPAAADAVLEFAAVAPPVRILEVGAGTGKATVLFAERGFGVTALEPSREMAQLARANLVRYPAVEIIESEFECWQPTGRFPVMISAAAWHWIAPEVRYERAGEALRHGGTLAAIWTLPDWERCELRQALGAAYADAAPDLEPHFPMHPASDPVALVGDWHEQIEAAEDFARSHAQTIDWGKDYTADDYTALLRTHQDHILLDDAGRAELLDAVAAAIDSAGGVLTLPLTTYVCLAARV